MSPLKNNASNFTNYEAVAASRALIADVKQEKRWFGGRKVCTITTDDITCDDRNDPIKRVSITTTVKGLSWFYSDEKLKSIARTKHYYQLIDNDVPASPISDKQNFCIQHIINITKKIFRDFAINWGLHSIPSSALTTTSPSIQGKKQAINQLKDIHWKRNDLGYTEYKWGDDIIQIANPEDNSLVINIPNEILKDILRSNILLNRELIFSKKELIDGNFYPGFKKIEETFKENHLFQNICFLLTQNMSADVCGNLSLSHLNHQTYVSHYSRDLKNLDLEQEHVTSYRIDTSDDKVKITLPAFYKVYQKGVPDDPTKADGYIAHKREITISKDELGRDYTKGEYRDKKDEEILPSLQINDILSIMYPSIEGAIAAAFPKLKAEQER
jgi:hypothetical protein